MRIHAFGLLAALAFPATASAVQPVTGRWITDDGKAVVTIADCGGTVCGRITRILAPTPNGAPVDSNNPDPSIRKRPILGLPVLTGFIATARIGRAGSTVQRRARRIVRS